MSNLRLPHSARCDLHGSQSLATRMQRYVQKHSAASLQPIHLSQRKMSHVVVLFYVLRCPSTGRMKSEAATLRICVALLQVHPPRNHETGARFEHFSLSTRLTDLQRSSHGGSDTNGHCVHSLEELEVERNASVKVEVRPWFGLALCC